MINATKNDHKEHGKVYRILGRLGPQNYFVNVREENTDRVDIIKVVVEL